MANGNTVPLQAASAIEMEGRLSDMRSASVILNNTLRQDVFDGSGRSLDPEMVSATLWLAGTVADMARWLDEAFQRTANAPKVAA